MKISRSEKAHEVRGSLLAVLNKNHEVCIQHLIE